MFKSVTLVLVMIVAMSMPSCSSVEVGIIDEDEVSVGIEFSETEVAEEDEVSVGIEPFEAKVVGKDGVTIRTECVPDTEPCLYGSPHGSEYTCTLPSGAPGHRCYIPVRECILDTIPCKYGYCGPHCTVPVGEFSGAPGNYCCVPVTECVLDTEPCPYGSPDGPEYFCTLPSGAPGHRCYVYRLPEK